MHEISQRNLERDLATFHGKGRGGEPFDFMVRKLALRVGLRSAG